MRSVTTDVIKPLPKGRRRSFGDLIFANLTGSFFSGSTWDPVHDVYSALPAVFGTLVSSLIALLVAIPVSLGTAIFLSELAPRWFRGPGSFVVEMLAAIPSVIIGLWGIFVMVPF